MSTMMFAMTTIMVNSKVDPKMRPKSYGGWIDSARQLTPEPAKLYTWWSYRAADWEAADKGRRLDHIWTSPQLADRVSGIAIAKTYRGAERPSDHVPVTATLEF